MARLSLRNLGKYYGETEIIRSLDLEVADGEFIVFVGPSGCGKSTLLRMIAGLEEITSGELWIDDQMCNDIAAKARGISMVFQSYALYPHKTVFKNMSFGLEIARVPRETIEAKVREAADILAIGHLLDRKPSQLSGGQRQRVAIGRAIVRDPKVFLFDEPLSNLDAALRVHMRMELAKLHTDLGTTMAYVTHDQIEAMTLADRIVVLDDGVARQVGTPLELYHTPRDTFVAGFIGSPKMNLLDVQVTDVGETSVTVQSDDVPPTAVPVRPSRAIGRGDTVTLGVRPEHVEPSADDHAMTCRIEVAENVGNHAMLKVRSVTGRSIVVIASGNELWRVGDTVAVTMGGENLHLFDGEGIALERLHKPRVLQ